MLPYGRQSIDESDIEAVAAVLRGDWLTTGPAVDAFEKDIAAIAGLETPAVSVTSGTAALHTAYAGLGVGTGDEVITTPLTFFATATTAMWQGARIVFADVCEDTGNLDPVAVRTP
jgi:Predicted pyridoxal phosphate-dependent enzyme apparently involved in regulation of cell wall biogenesis